MWFLEAIPKSSKLLDHIVVLKPVVLPIQGVFWSPHMVPWGNATCWRLNLQMTLWRGCNLHWSSLKISSHCKKIDELKWWKKSCVASNKVQTQGFLLIQGWWHSWPCSPMVPLLQKTSPPHESQEIHSVLGRAPAKICKVQNCEWPKPSWSHKKSNKQTESERTKKQELGPSWV